MELTEKIRKISERECNTLHHLPYQLWIGHCALVFDKAGVPRTNPIPEEYFDAVVDGIIESFYGGCEPEFETEESYDMFNKTVENMKTGKYVVEKRDQNGFVLTARSPYQDKTIPFLDFDKKY